MTTLLTTTSLLSLAGYIGYRISREKYQTKIHYLTRIERTEYKQLKKYGRITLILTSINIIFLLITKFVQ